MKKKITFMFLLAIIVLLLVAYFNLSKPVLKPPERLSNIPKQAEWVGGADGGSWFQITKVISKDAFTIKIYNEGTGELEIDTTFILNPACSIKEIDSATLIKSIDGYDGKKIELLLPEKGKRCSLILK